MSTESQTLPVIEIDLNRTPRKIKPQIQQRLENSPKTIFPHTPEELKTRIKKASERRDSLESAKKEKARREVEHAKLIAQKKKLSPETFKTVDETVDENQPPSD